MGRDWTVVVTRAEEEGGPLSSRLQARGAKVLLLPTVEITEPSQTDELHSALAKLPGYDWVVVTSPRAVDALAARGAAWTEGPSLAAVGRATARRAARWGVGASIVGTGEGAAELAEELVRAGVGGGSRVLFPCSSLAGDELERVLGEAGATVERVVAYETRPTRLDEAERQEATVADVVTFTSPSAVRGWHDTFRGDGGRGAGPRFVVIGSTTEAAASACGIDPVRAEEATLDGVADAAMALREPDE